MSFILDFMIRRMIVLSDLCCFNIGRNWLASSYAITCSFIYLIKAVEIDVPKIYVIEIYGGAQLVFRGPGTPPRTMIFRSISFIVPVSSRHQVTVNSFQAADIKRTCIWQETG